MSKDRRNIVTAYKKIIKDLLDNYDEYNDKEKKAIKDILSDLYTLNRSLNKYDKKPRAWEDEAKIEFDKFFG